MKDAHSAESNEKSYFRFVFPVLWLIAFTIYGDTPCVPPTNENSCSKVAKFTGKMRIDLTMIFELLSFFLRFLFFELWLIVFKIYQKFTDQKKK